MTRLSVLILALGALSPLSAGARLLDTRATGMTVENAVTVPVLRMVGGLGPFQGMGLQGSLDWRFEPAEGGTRITLRYVVGGYAASDLTTLAPVVDQVQGVQLGGLAAWLRARAPGKAPK